MSEERKRLEALGASLDERLLSAAAKKKSLAVRLSLAEINRSRALGLGWADIAESMRATLGCDISPAVLRKIYCEINNGKKAKPAIAAPSAPAQKTQPARAPALEPDPAPAPPNQLKAAENAAAPAPVVQQARPAPAPVPAPAPAPALERDPAPAPAPDDSSRPMYRLARGVDLDAYRNEVWPPRDLGYSDKEIAFLHDIPLPLRPFSPLSKKKPVANA